MLRSVCRDQPLLGLFFRDPAGLHRSAEFSLSGGDPLTHTTFKGLLLCYVRPHLEHAIFGLLLCDRAGLHRSTEFPSGRSELFLGTRFRGLLRSHRCAFSLPG